MQIQSFHFRFAALVFCLAVALTVSAQDKAALNEELLVAARKSNVELVKALLAKGADVDTKSPYGATPLFFACDRGNDVIVKILLDAGADPNVQDTFYKASALGWASGKSNPEVIRLLVEKGAKDIETAMNYAIEGKHVALAKTALDKGKFPQERLDKFLVSAKRKDSADVAAVLKAAGAKDTVAYEVSADKLKMYEGTFKNENLTIVFVVKDGKLVGSAQGQALTMTPTKEHVFDGVEQDTINLTFKVEAGKVAGLTFKNGNFQTELKKEEAK